MDEAPEVVALGHAIVDVLAPSPDALVEGFGLRKGTMTLVDEESSEKIYAALGPTTEASGGSAANTAACLASLGARAEFVGKVRDDALGRVFTHDIRAAGVRFEVPPAHEGPGTGRCLIMVTPDAEKTMCTNLGAGALLGGDDVGAAAPRPGGVLYIEGYLCGGADAAIEKAVTRARESGARVALTASDPNWVQLKHAELVALLERSDLLFANEEEACLLTDRDQVEQAVDALGALCRTVVVTLGARGCIAAEDGRVVRIPAAPVASVVDTTGAGDSFAAGYLFGEARGMGPERSARLGALAAAEVVGHLGARPLRPLAPLAAGV